MRPPWAGPYTTESLCLPRPARRGAVSVSRRWGRSGALAWSCSLTGDRGAASLVRAHVAGGTGTGQRAAGTPRSAGAQPLELPAPPARPRPARRRGG